MYPGFSKRYSIFLIHFDNAMRLCLLARVYAHVKISFCLLYQDTPVYRGRCLYSCSQVLTYMWLQFYYLQTRYKPKFEFNYAI